nr:condensation domain-containing protein [uncultured bacterium]
MALLQSPVVQGFRLSPQQRRVWRLRKAAPLSALRAEASFEVRGDLRLPVFREALRDLLARNEILRTTFPRTQGMTLPLQVIDEGELSLEEHDLRALSPEAQQAEVAAIEQRLRERGFDAESGPLWRVALASLSPERHVLILHLSALCGDAVALRNLGREIGRLYDVRLSGAPAEDEPLQYADLAEWQSGLLESEAAEVGRQYWKRQRTCDLAASRLGPQDGFAPRMRKIGLETSTERGIEALASRLGASVPSVVAAFWLLLLHRRLDARELVLGVPFDGRDYEELESALGPFARTLPFSSSFEGDLPLEELVQRFEAWSKETYEWQAFFAWDGIDGAAVPSCALAFESEVAPAGLRFALLGQRSYLEPFQLKLACLRTPEGLRLELHFDAGSVPAPEALRLALQLEALLARGVAAPPERPAGELDLLSPGERHRLLFEVNDTARAPGSEPDLCVHRLFERWAEATPEAPAVRFEDRCLTYRELNERANRLARSLRRLGVGPEERVGLRLERSEELLVALLGVLKAGGAYVPLDPGQPAERLAYILEAAGASVVVTDEGLADLLTGESGENLDDGAGPENLAYVIFTSGSTGRPKGVGIEHRHLASYVQAASERLAFEPGMTYATVTTLAADLGNTVIFPALVSGGCLDVIAEDRAVDPARLAERFRVQRPDCLKIVPSHLAALLDGAEPEAVLPRRKLVFGGEALSWSLVARVAEAAPDCKVFNHYGPSETTVGVIARSVEDAESATVPLGLPLAGVTVYLLDCHGHPVPAGLPGEVFLGGANVGRGYLGRPDLTAERFVPDPWGGFGRRLYRTGDLARRLPDGAVEFLGRVDFQVKIRGFRIEPEEIGAALERHPAVRQAVVVAREEGEEKRLVAYVVPAAGEPAARELRAFLQGSLPEYMIPSAFVLLDRLPLTANGKVDRAALPALEAERSGPAFVAPRTGIEELVAGIWSQVLGREPVGAHDDFFELGGHSLLATQVVSRVRQVFGLEVPLARIFDAPTVAGFAAIVAGVLEQRTGPPEPPLEAVPHDAGMPLSFAQERLWFLDQLQPGSSAYNLPAAVRMTGQLDPQTLAAALGELVRRHETLRTTFGSGPVQIISEPDGWTLPKIDLRGLPEPLREAEALRLAGENAGEPFDLERGPLLRTRLLALGPEEHVLLFNVHHIVSDGWSMGVLVREVVALYEGSPLPPLPIQYADFAAWQRRWLSGEVLAAQLRYWKEQLAGAPPLLELPTDRLRPAVRSGQGAACGLELPSGTAAALRDLSRREGATLFMTLMAAFAALLGRHTRQTDISIGSPIANRNRAEIEPLIGFFVNTLVLRVGLEGNPTFTDLLARVRQTSLGAYAHQDLPFEKLVEHLSPERSLGHTPLFQVVLVLQNAPLGTLELPDLSFEPLEIELRTAKFDLGLSWGEDQGRLLGRVEYSLDLFDASTIQRLIGKVRLLLETLAADPTRRLSELPLLAPSEQHQLLTEWNDTVSGDPHRSIPELFERQVERTPDAVALVAADRQLTYRELDREANRLARRLLKTGLEPDTPVGVFLERSPELIVALLAILKAGGAYLVLDLENPAERLRFLVQDARLRLVVSGDRPVPFDEVTLVPVHGTGDGEPIEPRSGPAHLAYVSYTSGSTGRPKGVCVEHRAVVRLVTNTNYLQIGPGDAFLQHSPVSFDASTLEIWGPLLNGGRLVVCPPGRLSIDELGRIVQRFGVTALWLTAGLFHAMAEHDLQALHGVRYLLAGGDVLSPEHMRAARAALPETRLINGYGPTENTTFTCCHPVGPEPDTSRFLPIGRPITNTRVYVLDPDLHPVPLGVSGELCTGGDGLARGYLGRPDLTAERFLPDPCSGFGQRLYRTGDLARQLADGTVEFLGRIDQQIKIRGFRIEPGEIETALLAHDRVQEAVVVPRPAPGGQRLVAYAVAATGSEPPSAQELRGFLSGSLPDYLVPSAFVLLPALPLSPNGKLDRAALPDPGQAAGPEREAAPPRDETERMLVQLWEDLLDVRPVGIRDDFFALGGHSLLALRVMGGIERLFGRKVPLSALLEAPTVERMAGLLHREGEAAAPSRVVPLQPRGTRLPLFLVHPVGGNVLCYAGLARELGESQPLYGLQTQGEPLHSVEEMASAYLETVREVRPSGPYRLGGWSFGGVVAYEMARQLWEAGQEVDLLVLIDSRLANGGSEIPGDAELFPGLLRDLAGVLGTDLPPEIEPGELRRLLEVYGNNLRAGAFYTARPYPGKVLVLQPSGRSAQDRAEDFARWSSFARAAELREVPGDHYTMFHSPHVQALADRLAEALVKE